MKIQVVYIRKVTTMCAHVVIMATIHQTICRQQAGVGLLIGFLDLSKLEMAGFVNGKIAQQCEASMTKSDGSDSL